MVLTLLKVSKYSSKKIEKLLNNPGIIRNRLKINATITNAKAFFRDTERIWKF